VPNVLFLCTGNSCRSQMAEGWLRHLAGDRFTAHSAGLQPSTVNPLAIAVMREVGIDISGHHSKDVVSFLGGYFPFLVTVCDRAKGACPIFPGVSFREHWPIDDPALGTGSEENRLRVFRAVRDEIGERVRGFIERQAKPTAANQTRRI